MAIKALQVSSLPPFGCGKRDFSCWCNTGCQPYSSWGHLYQDKGQPWQRLCSNSSSAAVTHSASGVSLTLWLQWGTAALVTHGDSAPVCPQLWARNGAWFASQEKTWECLSWCSAGCRSHGGPLLLTAVMQSSWAAAGPGICIPHPLGQLPPSPAVSACGIKFHIAW